MKGKDVFSTGEINEIRYLLKCLPNLPKPEKKRIRSTLRHMGFYISDFDQTYSGFSLDKFERLLDLHIVSISD